MIGLGLAAGAIVGLGLRIGRVLVATTAVVALDLGIHLANGDGILMALVSAALAATVMQALALLVFIFTDGFADSAAAGA